MNVVTHLGLGPVALFFMVTGAVFTPRLLGGWHAMPWRAFAISRLCRIVPMIVVSALVATAIIVAETGLLPDRHYPLQVLSWIAGLQMPLLGVESSRYINAGVLWSIFWEWAFYVGILPLCMAAAPLFRTHGAKLSLTIFLTCALLIDFFGVLRFVELFFLGILSWNVRQIEPMRRRLATPLAALVALIAVGTTMVLAEDPYGMWPGLAYGLLFACVACGNTLFGLLDRPGARVLGEISYSIYVLHGIFLYVAFRYLSARAMPMVALPLMAVAVTAVSAATFLWIEQPAIRWGKRLARRSRAA